MAKQKAPERQLAPAHKVTMQRVRLHVRACACVCACARSCLCDCLQSVHTCAKLCNALAVVCMHASLLVCSPIKHTPLVCVLQLSLFSCPQHTQTLRHTHTLVGIWAGICIGNMALVSGVHKKRQRAVIQTQPLVSFLGMCCVCECVCVCVVKRHSCRPQWVAQRHASAPLSSFSGATCHSDSQTTSAQALERCAQPALCE